MRRFLLMLALAATSGCATAKLVGDKAFTPPDPGTQRVLVLEPLFEVADWQTTTRTEYATMNTPGMGYSGFYGPGYGYGPSNVAITRQVQEKPLFARGQVLAEVHEKVLLEIQKRRPSWRVTSTAGVAILNGDVTVVRTVIQGNENIASDRTLKNLAFGFGLIILPLQLFNISPVHETVRVYGMLERASSGADAVKQRLVKYPTQPDYAVNMSGLPLLRREFGLDVSYEEGLLANEAPRTGVLIDGFVDRLASAVIAIVEENAAK